MKRYKVDNARICVGQVIKFSIIRKNVPYITVIDNDYTGKIKNIKNDTVTIDCSKLHDSNIQVVQLKELSNVQILEDVEQ